MLLLVHLEEVVEVKPHLPPVARVAPVPLEVVVGQLEPRLGLVHLT